MDPATIALITTIIRLVGLAIPIADQVYLTIAKKNGEVQSYSLKVQQAQDQFQSTYDATEKWLKDNPPSH